MVAQTAENAGDCTSKTTMSQRSIDSSPLGGSTPLKRPATNDGMSVVRKHFTARGISESATNLLMQSWRSGTKKQYSCYIKKWELFCAQRKTDCVQPPIEEVLDFLTELYSKGLTYSAINTARSALSTYVQVEGSLCVGQHPLVQ